MQTPSLLVIDGNSLLNRAFYGIRPLTTKDGRQTGAIFGFLNMLLPQLQALQPTHVAAAFDLSAPTFRHTLYTGYKSGRRSMPDELREQMEPAKEVLRAMGIQVLQKEGFEADDFLGSLSAMAERAGMPAYLLTGDRDSLQLISDKTAVLLVKTGNTTLYDPAKFLETYGVPASHYLDVKALMGDSSDAIPGVPGIGEKTAFKLIARYESIDDLYAALDSAPEGTALPDITPAIGKKLRAGRDSAYLSYKLAKIVRDVPLEGGIDQVKRSEIHREALLRLFTDLEFAGFIKKFELQLSSAAAASAAAPTPETSVADETPAAAVSFEPLPEQPSEALASIKSAAIALTQDEQSLLLLPEKEGKGAGLGYSIPLTDLSPLRAFLTGGCRFTVFDEKHLRLTLRRILPDLDFRAAFDLMLAGWVLTPDNPLDGGDGLTRLLLAHLHLTNENDAPETTLQHYFALRDALATALEKEGEDKLYYDIELPLSSLLADMEEAGAKVDVDGLIAFGEELGKKAEALEKEIYAMAGHPFNINSPKQLGTVLFEEMGLPAMKKTKRGYSTSAEVLEQLAPYAPIIPLIFDYRQAVKLRSTYAVALAAAADEHSRVHTRYRQTGTATGRLSSAEPNLQNIPVRTPLGREFRRFFVAEEGNVLIDADYSQIELRVLAALAQDEKMLAAFRAGDDIHSATAAEVFRVPPEEVTSELRSRAKAVNFGIVYGISDFSLGKDIGVSKATAGEYIKGYKETYRDIDRFLESAIEQAKATGYAVTALGRRRYIPELRSGKAMLRAFGERVARNSPIQGTAADIIKIAMLRTRDALQQAGLQAKLILQVHDELIVEAPEAEQALAAQILKTAMESVSDAIVGPSSPSTPPLFAATLECGKSWYECK